MGMRTKTSKSRSLKKAMAPTLALLACMTLGFVAPEMASAQIEISGGGGGGAGTGNGTDDTTAGSTGIMNGGAGGGTAEAGGAGGNYEGSGTAGTAGNVNGAGGSAAAGTGSTATAGTGAADTGTPANTGAGGGGGGGDGVATGAGSLANNGSVTATNGTGGTAAGVGGNGGAGQSMAYDLDTSVDTSVNGITISGGQAGQDGTGGATGGAGGSATLNAITAGTALSVNGNISVNTQAAQAGATAANGAATLNLGTQDVTMLSGAININAEAANAGATMNSLAGSNTNIDVISTAVGAGQASLAVTNTVTGAGAINVTAGAGTATFTAASVAASGDVNVAATGAAAASYTTNTTNTIGGNINITTAAAGGATFTSGGDVTMSAGKNITMTATGAGQSQFNAANVTGVNDIVLTAVAGAADFNATGNVTATGKIDVLATGAGSATFDALDVTLSGGAITVDSSTSTGGNATFTSTGTTAITDAGSISVKSGAVGTAGFSALNGEVSLVNGSNITLNSTAGAAASFAAGSLYAQGNTTVDLSAGNANTFAAGTGLKIGDGNQDSTFTFKNNATAVTWGMTLTDLEMNRGTLDLTDATNTGTYGTNYTLDNSNMKFTGGNTIKTNGDTIATTGTVDFDLTGLQAGQAVLTGDNTNLNFTGVGAVTLTTTGQTGIIGAVQEEINMIGVSGTGAITAGSEGALANQFITAGGTNGESRLVQYGVGTFYGYDVIADVAGDRFYLKSNGAGTDTFDLYSDAGAAQILTLTQSGQLVIDSVGRMAHRNGEGFKMDLNMAGFSYDNNVGSKVEVDGFGAVLSLGYTAEGAANKFTFGGFVEAGNGSYDAYNTLSVYGNSSGDGETKYFGGGLFAHNIWDNGFYVEASGRIGSADHDFSYNNHAGHQYDGKSSTYYGLHAGLGYKFAPSWEKGEFDVYGKFAWTHMDGYDFRLSAIEKLKMDDIDSYRTRLGARYTHTYNNGTELYVGAAWDHEFDGESKGSIVGGNRIKNYAKTEGSSAFFETGLRINPADTPVSIDVGIFGTAGQNEGFGGTVGLKWEF